MMNDNGYRSCRACGTVVTANWTFDHCPYCGNDLEPRKQKSALSDEEKDVVSRFIVDNKEFLKKLSGK